MGTTISRSFKACADFDPARSGARVENAVKMLGASRLLDIPLVVSPEMGPAFFIVAMRRRTRSRRRSLAGKIDGEVAAAAFNLIDDGRLKGGLSTAPVDGEGAPTQTTPLIVAGVLKAYLFDSYCAKKGKTKSTGNRIRQGYSSAGGIGPTNLYLKPGEGTAEEIIGGIDRGFYLTQAIGLFAD
jgi:PmbA protein